MINAQEWLDKNYADKDSVTKITEFKQELEGELIIADYSNLEEIEINPFLRKAERKINKVIIRNCPKLKKASLTANNINDLLITDCPELKELRVAYNKLTKLNTSSLTNLTYLGCASNNLTELDLSQCSQLEVLKCDNNKLHNLKLNVSNTLKELFCHVNQLTNLDLTNYSNLIVLSCEDNPNLNPPYTFLDQWKQELNQLKTKLEDLSKKKYLSEEDYANLGDQAALIDSLSQKEEQLKEYEKKLLTAQKKTTFLEKNLAEVTEIQKKFVTLLENNKKTYQEQISQLETKIQELETAKPEDKSLVLTEQHEQEKKVLADNLLKEQGAKEALEKQLANKEQSLTLATTNKQQLEQKIIQLKKEINDKDNLITPLNDKITQLESELTQLKNNQIYAQQAVKTNTQKWKKEKDTLLAKVKQLEQEITKYQTKLKVHESKELEKPSSLWENLKPPLLTAGAVLLVLSLWGWIKNKLK